MKIKKIIGTILIAVLGGIIAVLAYTMFESDENPQIVYKEPSPGRLVSLDSGNTQVLDFSYAAENSVNAVVHVKTQYKHLVTGYSGNPLYDFFFGHQQFREETTPVLPVGSGVIITDNGYIVTNNHVIQKAEYVEVVLNDKRTFPAEVIGSDPSTDIALLKIDEEGLPFMKMGDSDHLKLGDWVLAVGNPFNLTSTITAGIVSAKARNINILNEQYAIESFIQTDAAVNPGNSGGALVDLTGELVGINTAIATRTGSFSGYSFAIPVNIVKKIVSDLKEFGEVQRAFIGVSISDINAEKAEELGLDQIKGVYINGLTRGGAAADAGIKEGDIIVGLGGKAVDNVSELQEQISKYRPGNEVSVAVKRDGKEKKFMVTLRNKQGNTDIVKTEDIRVLGAKLKEIPMDAMRKLRIKNGLQVTDLEKGKLMEAGVKEGFIITSVNRMPVYSVDDFLSIINSIEGGVYIEGIYPNGMTAYYAFGM